MRSARRGPNLESRLKPLRREHTATMLAFDHSTDRGVLVSQPSEPTGYLTSRSLIELGQREQTQTGRPRGRLHVAVYARGWHASRLA